MTLSFELSMPNRASWNNQWSGQNNFYGIIKSFTSKKGKEKAAEIINKSPYRYSFGDGWVALVTVRHIDKIEAQKLRNKTQGFCGYDWMVDSILDEGYIK